MEKRRLFGLKESLAIVDGWCQREREEEEANKSEIEK